MAATATKLPHEPDRDGICFPDCAACRENLMAGLDPDGGPRTPGLAYLIYTRDGLWWRPNGGGYTSSVSEAGVYSEKASHYLLGESFADRRDSICLARPHLERANRAMRSRLEALALVEAGQDRA